MWRASTIAMAKAAATCVYAKVVAKARKQESKTSGEANHKCTETKEWIWFNRTREARHKARLALAPGRAWPSSQPCVMSMLGMADSQAARIV